MSRIEAPSSVLNDVPQSISMWREQPQMRAGWPKLLAEPLPDILSLQAALQICKNIPTEATFYHALTALKMFISDVEKMECKAPTHYRKNNLESKPSTLEELLQQFPPQNTEDKGRLMQAVQKREHALLMERSAVIAKISAKSRATSASQTAPEKRVIPSPDSGSATQQVAA